MKYGSCHLPIRISWNVTFGFVFNAHMMNSFQACKKKTCHPEITKRNPQYWKTPDFGWLYIPFKKKTWREKKHGDITKSQLHRCQVFEFWKSPKNIFKGPVLVFLNRHFQPIFLMETMEETEQNMRTGGLWKRELRLSHQCWSNRNHPTKWLFQRKMPVNRATQSGTRVPLGCARALRPAKVRGDSGDDDGIHGWWSSQSRGWSADTNSRYLKCVIYHFPSQEKESKDWHTHTHKFWNSWYSSFWWAYRHIYSQSRHTTSLS